MQLAILGVIVFIGALLMIYYQLGAEKQSKLKNKVRDFFSDILGGPVSGGGYTSSADDEDVPDEDDEPRPQREVKSLPGEEKVLYIFGDGAREERPLDDEDGKDENA